ncbi:MAG: hypothetical protein AVDCRST_MAG35-1687, partial [uncultured Quadrisphaera sp.]
AGGLLAREGDRRDLAAALAALLADPARGRAMGLAGRRRVEEHFDIRQRTAALEQIYDRVSASPGPPPGRRAGHRRPVLAAR